MNAEQADGTLSVADLCRMFEEAEEATYTARQLAERDRDYVDNKQLTADEEATLKKRGQPPVIINRIKGKIEFLVGMEKERRVDPRAFPRTPKHEQDADGASQALKYALDEQRYDVKRSGVWRNLCVEGSGGIEVAVEDGYDGPQIVLRRVAWDRMFYDPHSSEPDFSDAGYKGVVVWMDYDDAVLKYPDAKEALDATMAERGNNSDTFDDKPKWRLWADKKRKRVRVCQIWIRRDDQWHFAEFTKGGILKAGPSPYVTDKGESDDALVFASGYVDRENNRYGIVREMISPQDEVNKRRSKALHLLNTAQVFYEDGAIDDIEKFRKEVARPDGTPKVNPGALRDGAVKVETRVDLATAQFQLLQESKNEIDLRGPNATMMGEKAQGSSSASGKAIIASQQGGMMEIGELLDNLRDLDIRVFRKVWWRIRQFWTAEKWIRTTDDERNIKWVGMNVDPMQMQALQMQVEQNPEMQKKIAGMVQSVAELDCDIIIDEVPDSVTPALEQWQGLVELAKSGIPIPPDVLIEAAPNLKNKDKLLERMNQPNPQVQQAQQIQTAGAMAEVEETKSRAALNMAKARGEMMPDAPDMPMHREFEIPPQLQMAKAAADIDYVRANTENKQVQTALLPARAAHDAGMKQAQLQQRSWQPQRPAA